MAVALAPQKRWLLAPTATPDALAPLLPAVDDDVLLARILKQRGIETAETAHQFLNPEAFDKHWGDKLSGAALPYAQDAIDRLNQAIDQQETIVVYGDFDVDGVTGTCIFVETLSFLKAKVDWYIPDRMSESHGLNSKALVKLVAFQKPQLIVTTDTGIMNHREIQLLKNLKVDVIVTDHHGLPEELPPAVASVNPRLLRDKTHPLEALCGAGTAYKLCVLLLEQRKPRGYKKFIEKLMDLAAIGTVADLVPLTMENRRIVQRGLPVIAARGRLGVRILLEKAGVSPDNPITSELIAFTIGPRINAVGRLAHAEAAVKLMLTQDETEASTLADELEKMNRERQRLCDETFQEAMALAPEFLDAHRDTPGGSRLLFLKKADWHPGVIGIVGSRLIEQFHRPVFLACRDEETGLWRGSARSIEGYAIHEALDKCTDLLTGFGGHAGAGGFKLDAAHLDTFISRLMGFAHQWLTDDDCRPTVKAHAPLTPEDVTEDVITRLERLQPFGMGNPEPLFWTPPLAVRLVQRFGRDNKHVKLQLSDPQLTSPLEAIQWSVPETTPLPSPGSKVEAIGKLEKNNYAGGPPIRLMMKAWRDPDALPATPPTTPAPPSQEAPTLVPVVTPPPKPAQPALAAPSAPAPPPSLTVPQAVPPTPEAPAPPVPSYQAGPPAATPTTAAPQPTPARSRSPVGQKPSGPALQAWPRVIDHRQAMATVDHVRDLLAAHLTPPADSPEEFKIADPQQITVFIEGQISKDLLPLAQQVRLCNRLDAAPCQALLLWDVPPSLEVLRTLLTKAAPRWVHVLGGKYQNIPLAYPPGRFLKGVVQLLAKQPALVQEAPDVVATRMATTPTILHSTLWLLETWGLIAPHDNGTGFDVSPEALAEYAALPETDLQAQAPPAFWQALSHQLDTVAQCRALLLKDLPGAKLGQLMKSLSPVPTP